MSLCACTSRVYCVAGARWDHHELLVEEWRHNHSGSPPRKHQRTQSPAHLGAASPKDSPPPTPEYVPVENSATPSEPAPHDHAQLQGAAGAVPLDGEEDEQYQSDSSSACPVFGTSYPPASLGSDDVDGVGDDTEAGAGGVPQAGSTQQAPHQVPGDTVNEDDGPGTPRLRPFEGADDPIGDAGADCAVPGGLPRPGCLQSLLLYTNNASPEATHQWPELMQPSRTRETTATRRMSCPTRARRCQRLRTSVTCLCGALAPAKYAD